MGAIVQALQFLLNKVVQALTWIGKLFIEVFVSLWEVVTDLVCWTLEGALDLVVSALGSLELEGLTGHLGAWGSLPGDVLEVLAAIGLGPALGVIAAALTVRLTLQLIPFTRLGS